MIAVDTNILVYAFREDSDRHGRARAAVEGLVHSGRQWALTWPTVHEFIAVTTRPGIFDPPSPVTDVMTTLSGLAATGTVRFLSETSDHLTILAEVLTAADVRGPKVHDARIAAICLGHGVAELWSADRDFSYFPRLRVKNPLVEAS